MSISALVFLAIFTTTVLLALFRHPIFGLYSYLLAFYGYPSGRWWGDDLPDLRWSLTAAAVALVAIWLKPNGHSLPRWYSNAVAYTIIAFSAWLALQSFWALMPSEHNYLVTVYTKYIVLLFMMHRILTNEKMVELFAIAHVAGCAYYGWLAFRTAGAGRFEYIGGPNMDGANAFAVQLSTGLIFAGVLFLKTRGYMRLLSLLSIPFILNAIVLTQSRGGFLGLLAGGLAVLYLCPRNYKKKAYLAGALGVILLSFLAHEVFWDRMETIASAVEQQNMDSSAESRWILIGAQWEMFQLNPVFGSGHRGTVAFSPIFLDEVWLSQGGRSSHNTIMTLLVEQGLIGFGIFFGCCWWAVKRLREVKLMDRDGLPDSLGLLNAAIGGALTCIFVSGQFADLLRLEVIIWCLMLLVIVLRLSRSALKVDAVPGSTGKHKYTGNRVAYRLEEDIARV